MLLEVFAVVRSQRPDLRLIQVGGEWTEEQQLQIRRLGLDQAIFQVRGLSRETLASLYRLCEIILLPSDAEGFGLPVVEALACGALVLASDIPVLREVGGDAVVYCPVGVVEHWARMVEQMLANPSSAPAMGLRLARAQLYSWANHARTVATAYLRLAGEGIEVG